jgi:hypothetical protein
MTVASTTDFNSGSTAETAPPANGAVTITITGPIAEEMIGRGDAQKQQIGDLVQKLAALEAAAVQRVAGQER